MIIQKRYELKRKLTLGELLDLESGKTSIWNLDCFCEHSFEELSVETESQKIVTFNKESGFFETVIDY